MWSLARACLLLLILVQASAALPLRRLLSEGEVDHDHGSESSSVETWEKWVYGLLASVIVSVMSLIGILVFVVKDKWLEKVQSHLLMFSAGTLLGASFFGLIPETFETIGLEIQTSTLILAGIVFSLAIEVFLNGFHQHQRAISRKLAADQGEGDGSLEGTVELAELPPVANGCDFEIPPAAAEIAQLENEDSDEQYEEVQRMTMITVNLSGDALHNLIDGILIGVSFASDSSSGVTTTLAVILHELPQELGDFMILRHAGMSIKSALCWNFFTACTAIVGAVIGIAAGESSEAFANHCLPFAAGIFIALALVQLIPGVMRQARTLKDHLYSAIFGSLGLGLILISTLVINHDH